jgi:hypothetical protein
MTNQVEAAGKKIEAAVAYIDDKRCHDGVDNDGNSFFDLTAMLIAVNVSVDGVGIGRHFLCQSSPRDVDVMSVCADFIENEMASKAVWTAVYPDRDPDDYSELDREVVKVIERAAQIAFNEHQRTE